MQSFPLVYVLIVVSSLIYLRFSSGLSNLPFNLVPPKLGPCLIFPRALTGWNHSTSRPPVLHNTYCLLFCVITLFVFDFLLLVSLPAKIPKGYYDLNKYATWLDHCISQFLLSICLFWAFLHHHWWQEMCVSEFPILS